MSARYLPALAAHLVKPDTISSATVGGHVLILTRWRGKVYAFSAGCPHAGADLREGRLARGQISCADHDYKFDVATGRTLWPPDEMCRLRHFPTRERDGMIDVEIP